MIYLFIYVCVYIYIQTHLFFKETRLIVNRQSLVQGLDFELEAVPWALGWNSLAPHLQIKS